MRASSARSRYTALNDQHQPNARCGTFADHYVKHGALTLLLDLVPLKLGVYRHLAYNHCAPQRRIAAAGADAKVETGGGRWGRSGSGGEGDGAYKPTSVSLLRAKQTFPPIQSR